MTLSLVLVLLLCALACSCWGPGNHLEFASRVLRRRRETLPADVARLLGSERAAFCYGNIAADIINFKAYGGHYNHCHRWTIVKEMQARATTDAQHAFALGYLAHLAADTIAHNHFVPYHLARYQRGHQLGHLYWEMSADRLVPEERWSVVTELKSDASLTGLDELVNASVPVRALSIGTNKLIFDHVLLVSEGLAYRRAMERLHPLSHVRLERPFLGLFQEAAVERIRLALHPSGLRKLLHIDTNGKQAQRAALESRRGLLRRLTVSNDDRKRLAEERAAPFLEGMESPPRNGGAPHW